VAPVISSWLRPRFRVTSRFGFNRDPNARTPVRIGPDSSAGFRVPETLLNVRDREVGALVDLGKLVRGVAGDSAGTAGLARAILPADLSYRTERRSVFDRALSGADLRYQLALGGLDEFRERNGVPATSAAELTETNASGGMLLPLGGQVRLGYRSSRYIVWSRRVTGQSEVRQRTREWPSVSVSWVHAPEWALRELVANLTARVRYQVSTKVMVQSVRGGGGAPDAGGSRVRTENNTRLVSPTMTIAWVGGVVTTGGITVSTTEVVTAGNVTQTDRLDWGGSVSFVFSPPTGLFSPDNRIRTTGRFSSSKVSVCLLSVGADECRTVADSRRQRVDVRMDTGLSPIVRGGASFSYVLSDQRHTSNKLSQLVFSIFADINLFAGRIQ
jgi:hypothetical protein